MLEPLNYFLSFAEPQTAVNVVTIPRTGLRMRFIFMGMLQLVLVPFLLLFMIMHYFLQHAQDWYASRCDQLSFVSCHRHRIGCMRAGLVCHFPRSVSLMICNTLKLILAVLRTYLGPREWTLLATWSFREFNELVHFFERRMEGSYECATAYLREVCYAFQCS